VSLAAAEARRLAVAVVLAVHDRDRQRLRHLVEAVPAGSMVMVIESLAAIADEGVRMAMRNPDAAREALAGVALDLASELPSRLEIGASRKPTHGSGDFRGRRLITPPGFRRDDLRAAQTGARIFLRLMVSDLFYRMAGDRRVRFLR
jgi:hypothetical protein